MKVASVDRHWWYDRPLSTYAPESVGHIQVGYVNGDSRLRVKSFFLSGFSFTDTDDSKNSRGKECLYSSLPFPPTHKHSEIYLQLRMWDNYHVILVAPLVTTRLYSMRFSTLLNYYLIIWVLTLYSLVVTKKSHILKQTCSLLIYVNLGLIYASLLDNSVPRFFLLQQFDIRNRWIRNRMY